MEGQGSGVLSGLKACGPNETGIMSAGNTLEAVLVLEQQNARFKIYSRYNPAKIASQESRDNSLAGFGKCNPPAGNLGGTLAYTLMLRNLTRYALQHQGDEAAVSFVLIAGTHFGWTSL